ncbi:acyltransferase family protein [Dyella japonica]|uniref:Peptidoglycan/LPS O-acetylase OafA/YrhL n=1 Tax=Dyella japonica TaxID=231455 RepID=A0ABV2JUN4_9GAMM
MKRGDYQLGYRGDIEGLRALAIALVVGAHAGIPWLAGGFVGVDVFFVLSGFLITGLLLRELENTGSIAFGDFYLRRLRRLMPALILMIVVTSLVAAVVLAPGEQLQQPSAAAMAALWASNIYYALVQMDYFAPGTDSNLFLHTWSLGVEEQFYLVWPLLLLALGRARDGKRTGQLRWVMVALVVSGLIASWLLTPRFPQWAFYMMPVRAWEFAAGALIWLGLRGNVQGLFGPRAARGVVQAAGWVGFLLVATAALTYGANTPYPGWRAAIPVVGAVLMVWAGSHGDGIGLSRLLALRPMQMLGRVSYAWYLWHWPALLLGYAIAGSHDPMVRLASVTVALGLAAASYRWVEYPVRHQSWWLDRPRMALMGCLAIMVLVNLLTMAWFNTTLVRFSSPEMQRYAAARSDTPAIYRKGCDDFYYSSAVKPCYFGPSSAPHTAVLMGDSIAGQWFPAVAEVFGKSDWRLVVLTKSSCPMVDESFFYARIGREYTECSEWRRNALAQLSELHPDMVLLSTVATDGFSQAQWVEGTSRVLGSIDHSASRILILRGTPRLPFDGLDCLAAHQGRPKWLGARQSCDAPSSDPHDELVLQWLQQASSRFTNVQIIDMNDRICPQGRCAAEMGGVIVFRDSQHMTASFAKSLAPELGRRIGDLQTGTSHASLAGARP